MHRTIPLSKLVEGRHDELFDLPPVRSHVLRRVRENAKEVSAVWSDRVEKLKRRHETELRKQAEIGRSLRAQLTKSAKKIAKASAGEKRFQTLLSQQKRITTKVQDEKKHLLKRKANELAAAATSVDNLRRCKRKLEKDVSQLTNDLNESKRHAQESKADCADVKDELYQYSKASKVSAKGTDAMMRAAQVAYKKWYDSCPADERATMPDPRSTATRFLDDISCKRQQ